MPNGHTQALACQCADQLAHTGDLERSFLDHVSYLADGAVTCAANCGLHNARTGNANVDNGLRFTDASGTHRP